VQQDGRVVAGEWDERYVERGQPDVAARLGDGWLVEVNQERPRVGP